MLLLREPRSADVRLVAINKTRTRFATLRAGLWPIAPQHSCSTALLYCYTAIALHHSTSVRLPLCTATLSHYCTSVLLHLATTAALLYCCIYVLLHLCTAALPNRTPCALL